MFGYSVMAFASAQDFLHVLAIAVHVDDGGPVLDCYDEDIHFGSDFDVALLADLKVLELEYCSFLSFHTGDESFNFEVSLADVVLDLRLIHQIERAVVFGVLFFLTFC